jgi:hypothetical protein
MTTEEKPLNIVRLEHAWSLILNQFFDLAQEASKSEGPGINIFKMLRKGTETSNCQYYYAARDSMPFNVLFEAAPNGKALLKAYDPSKHLFIAVCIHTSDSGEETTQNIRIFNSTNRTEVMVI